MIRTPLLEATLGVTAPAEFCSLAVEELEVAGLASVKDRTKRVEELWASSRVQTAYSRIKSRTLQISGALTVGVIILEAAAGLGPSWILGSAIATALIGGALVQRFYKQRLRATTREGIEFGGAAET